MQDVVNAKQLLLTYEQNGRTVPQVIKTSEEVKWMQLKVEDAKTLSSILKLSPSIVYRLNDLIVWSRLANLPSA